MAILGVESTSLKEPFKGTIRKEDVRATEKDKVEMYKSFRPGDIVLARVLTPHTQTYLLSTAENELGVVFAKSEAGKRFKHFQLTCKTELLVGCGKKFSCQIMQQLTARKIMQQMRAIVQFSFTKFKLDFPVFGINSSFVLTVPNVCS